PLWQAVLPLHGVVLVFLFTLEHEATHKTPFASVRLNEWAGRLTGLMILLPFEWFRYFHLAHHRHTNIPGNDPELAAGAHPETWREYLLYASGLRYWRDALRQVLVNAVGGDPGEFVPPRAQPRVTVEARWMLAAYALAGTSLLFSPLLLWIWVLPMLLGQPVLRLYLLAEHGRCAFVANMFENTRTTLTNRAVRFLAWNMPYHVEHHTLPLVPFHRLPELHAKMRGHLEVTAPSYRAFTLDYAAGLSRSTD
ncbi:MAG: fatty acid desaturase, partial [Pseudomonadota bacterium]